MITNASLWAYRLKNSRSLSKQESIVKAIQREASECAMDYAANLALHLTDTVENSIGEETTVQAGRRKIHRTIKEHRSVVPLESQTGICMRCNNPTDRWVTVGFVCENCA